MKQLEIIFDADAYWYDIKLKKDTFSRVETIMLSSKEKRTAVRKKNEPPKRFDSLPFSSFCLIASTERGHQLFQRFEIKPQVFENS